MVVFHDRNDEFEKLVGSNLILMVSVESMGFFTYTLDRVIFLGNEGMPLFQCLGGRQPSLGTVVDTKVVREGCGLEV